MTHQFNIADALDLPISNRFADLVFYFPPYEDARTYDIQFSTRGEYWVAWAKDRFLESLRICKGLVVWVVEGKTRDFRWSATPALLTADLHRAGVRLRKPPVFHRVGIPGSGGPDWLRNDYEFIVCATNSGKLPWSDNVAMGKPCGYPPGGVMSNRTQDGQRCLAEFFIRSFCPPGGIVIDPFSGSDTTVCVAEKWGRSGYGFDIRQSQVDLGYRCLAEVKVEAT